MCTLVILRRPGHRWPVLIGANRDEMIDRASKPPGRHWPDRPELVAGRDILAGGSWLGVNDWGVVAAVLNRHGSLGPAPDRRSRGELVLEALDHADAAAAARALADLDPEAYRTFNLIIADESGGFWLRHAGGPRVELKPLKDGLSMIAAGEMADLGPRSRRLGCVADLARQHPGAAERAGQHCYAVSHRRLRYRVECADRPAGARRIGAAPGIPVCRMAAASHAVARCDGGFVTTADLSGGHPDRDSET